LRKNALDTGIAVKPLIEAHHLLDLMTLHYGDVERTPSVHLDACASSSIHLHMVFSSLEVETLDL
jgi:hypothetical protein